MLKVGIIGFGGIAQAQHLKPHIALEEKGVTKLVAVCDICADRFEETKEINLGKTNAKLGDDVKKYTNWKEMLEKEDLDMVDICMLISRLVLWKADIMYLVKSLCLLIMRIVKECVKLQKNHIKN